MPNYKTYGTLAEFLIKYKVELKDLVIRTSDTYYTHPSEQTVAHLMGNQIWIEPIESYNKNGIIYVQD